MGRGPSLKTKKREAEALVQSRMEALRKFYKKNPQVWIGERISSVIANSSLKDVTELAATLGMTVIVKGVIEGSADLIAKTTGFLETLAPISWVWIAGSPLLAQLFAGQKVAEKIEVKAEALKWVMYFCFAYIIIHHFGDIMRGVGDVSAGVKGILTGLLA